METVWASLSYCTVHARGLLQFLLEECNNRLQIGHYWLLKPYFSFTRFHLIGYASQKVIIVYSQNHYCIESLLTRSSSGFCVSQCTDTHLGKTLGQNDSLLLADAVCFLVSAFSPEGWKWKLKIQSKGRLECDLSSWQIECTSAPKSFTFYSAGMLSSIWWRMERVKNEHKWPKAILKNNKCS